MEVCPSWMAGRHQLASVADRDSAGRVRRLGGASRQRSRWRPSGGGQPAIADGNGGDAFILPVQALVAQLVHDDDPVVDWAMADALLREGLKGVSSTLFAFIGREGRWRSSDVARFACLATGRPSRGCDAPVSSLPCGSPVAGPWRTRRGHWWWTLSNIGREPTTTPLLASRPTARFWSQRLGLGHRGPDRGCAWRVLPRAHSINVGGAAKLVGTSRRVVRGAWLFSALIVLDDQERVAQALADIYGAFDHPFDPTSVGSVFAEVPPVRLLRSKRPSWPASANARLKPSGSALCCMVELTRSRLWRCRDRPDRRRRPLADDPGVKITTAGRLGSPRCGALEGHGGGRVLSTWSGRLQSLTQPPTEEGEEARERGVILEVAESPPVVGAAGEM